MPPPGTTARWSGRARRRWRPLTAMARRHTAAARPCRAADGGPGRAWRPEAGVGRPPTHRRRPRLRGERLPAAEVTFVTVACLAPRWRPSCALEVAVLNRRPAGGWGAWALRPCRTGGSCRRWRSSVSRRCRGPGEPSPRQAASPGSGGQGGGDGVSLCPGVLIRIGIPACAGAGASAPLPATAWGQASDSFLAFAPSSAGIVAGSDVGAPRCRAP